MCPFGDCAATLVVIGAALVVEAERHEPGANITGYGTALWWSVTTITTVGSGDHYPVTAAGQAVAASMVLLGVSLMGLLTAAVAAVFASWTPQEAEATTAPPSPECWDAVVIELAELREQLTALSTSSRPGEQRSNTRPSAPPAALRYRDDATQRSTHPRRRSPKTRATTN